MEADVIRLRACRWREQDKSARILQRDQLGIKHRRGKRRRQMRENFITDSTCGLFDGGK